MKVSGLQYRRKSCVLRYDRGPEVDELLLARGLGVISDRVERWERIDMNIADVLLLPIGFDRRQILLYCAP